jgi:hypothetical protein
MAEDDDNLEKMLEEKREEDKEQTSGSSSVDLTWMDKEQTSGSSSVDLTWMDKERKRPWHLDDSHINPYDPTLHIKKPRKIVLGVYSGLNNDEVPIPGIQPITPFFGADREKRESLFKPHKPVIDEEIQKIMDSIDMTDEEYVTVLVKEPIEIGKIFRTYKMRKDGIKRSPDTVLYAKMDGERKELCEIGSSSESKIESIESVVLSPDASRVAFVGLTSSREIYGHTGYNSDFEIENIRVIAVVDMEGKHKMFITPDSLGFELPYQGGYAEGAAAEGIVEETRDLKRYPAAISSLYSAEWVGDDILRFKGTRYYVVKNPENAPKLRGMGYSNRNYHVATGPECTIEAKLDDENNLVHAEMVR